MNQPIQKATLQSVAEAAGVSIKTVSRVVNNEPNVNATLRAKVQSIIDELDYKPNLSARRLKGVSTYSFTMVYEPPGSEFLTSILEGSLSVCRETDYQLILEPLAASESQFRIDQMIRRQSTDGFILLPPLSEDAGLIKRILDAGLQVVLIASTITTLGNDKTVNKIGINDFEAGEEIGRHLLDQGHTQIGYIALRSHHAMANQRGDGLKAAMRAVGLPVSNFMKTTGDSSFPSGYAAAKKLLARKTPPTAIFAGNDFMAGGVVAYAAEAGLNVPNQLAVCGFDGSDYSKMITTPLSTVVQPLGKYGQLATRVLLDNIADRTKDAVQIEVEYQFVPRISTLSQLKPD